ncbi:unnamed protein product [Agarophyton chilense]|eukprot:gb/GEZJ01000392.1/.p1 GENE.gb/GEZJ01000392.1/~~gb/GEZJ01000392.1/.p1  ORF type:complete len:387 (-),score=52.64 gb/GEZJ01000392.1/:2000-3160(-)
MSITETFLPRHILFNAALYTGAALVYTVVIFSLETSRPGEYVFYDSDKSKWRSIYNNICIISWPILLFGALILLAVRVGANVRRRRRKRSKKKKKKNRSSSKNSLSDRNTSNNSLEEPRLPPSTTPPAVPLRLESAHRDSTPSLLQDTPSEKGEEDPPIVRAKSSRKAKRAKSGTFHVPKGYVSVTRTQRLFAAFGFLWVAVGLALTAAAAAIVFVGQRERFRQVATRLGNKQEDWKTWVIPICTGGILVVLYGTLAITTLTKFFSTLTARTSMPTRGTAASEGSVREVEDLDLLYESGKELSDDDRDDANERSLASVITPAVTSSQNRMIGTMVLPNSPDQSTIDRLMRQLRDMGFRNPDQNMAALQASSFDLEKASDKLVNTAT